MGDYADGMRRKRIARERARAMQSETQRRKKKLAGKVLWYSVGTLLNSLWWAQVTCWGLSAYHVNSGLFGPFALITVLTGLGAAAVCLGMLVTALRMNDLGGGE